MLGRATVTRTKAPRVTVPLPTGFGVEFDAETQFVGSDVLFGGSPARFLRLNRAGVRALEELRDGPVGSTESGRLARRLTDTGMAHPCPPPLRGPADATVVIPVRDRAVELDRCLSALGTGNRVIVVDDGSLDPEAVAGVCTSHGAELIRRPVSGGPGPARNDGLAMVTTPLVAFLDSDCVADPGWITGLAAHFADPMVGAVAPRVVGATGGNATSRFLDARAPLDMGARPARVAPLTRAAYVPTAALLVRREAVVEAGESTGWAFDPGLRYGEDVDLVWRLCAAGWRVRYDPAAEVRHVEPVRWLPILSRRFRYGTSAAPLTRRHPGLVPPLVLQAWPAATVAALLARSPVIAVAAHGAGTYQLVRLLRGWDVPARGIFGPMGESVKQTWLGVGQWSIQFGLPVVAAGIARPGGRTRRTRLGRRLALASLLAGPPAAAWMRSRPRLDPFRFALGYLADEAAYGAGVYRGAITERLAAPLLPRFAWRPLPKARPRNGQPTESTAAKAPPGEDTL
jgi:mycofactocin system glycosyltransferase